MNIQVNRNYIRRQFEEIEKGSIYKTSTGDLVQPFRLITTSKEAEDFLSERSMGIKRGMIHFTYRHKETLKKIPIIGKALVKRKNNMLKTAYQDLNTGDILNIDSIIRLPYEEFITGAYHLLLNREPDMHGLFEYNRHACQGASNEAIAYMFVTSKEYNYRYNIKNIQTYEREYRKYKRKTKWYKMPFARNSVKINVLAQNMQTMTNSIQVLSDRLISTCNRVDEFIGNENNNTRSDKKAVEIINEDLDNMKKLLINTEKRVSQAIEEGIAAMNEEMLQMNQTAETYVTIISQKLDVLPSLLMQNDIKNKSMVTSIPGGVVAVQAGDFIMGIPSEEWGLAMYLSLNGHFEQGSEQLFCSLLKENMTVVDVGANLGIYTLHALRAGCKVYSYEPTPATYDLLNKNIKVNGFLESNRASTYNYAVGENEDLVRFSICKGICGQNHIAVDDNLEDSIEVPVVSLDHQHKGEKIDFIKIDIEGAEYAALKGMQNIIKENPDIKILMEFAPVFIERAGVEPKELLNLIYKMGLKIQKIDESTSKLYDISESELMNEFSVNLLLSYR